jgi:pimeloyl-ACP methyl ester carboxylesterase
MTAEAGVRLITVCRPGYGRSDPKPVREIIEWAADIAELATPLRVDEFDIAGSSPGGPYAVACAYVLPGRVQRGLDQLHRALQRAFIAAS